MIKKISGIILIGLAIVLGGCSSEEGSTKMENTKVEGEETKNELKEAEPAEATDTGEATNSEYPMPIIDGWEELEVTFKEVSEGRIEMWSGEFEYEGATGEQFELYQSVLTDAGFAIGETDDTENMQTIEFTKTIDGKDWVGNASFNQRWVKSGLQHFK